jgi:hypothetical protein
MDVQPSTHGGLAINGTCGFSLAPCSSITRCRRQTNDNVWTWGTNT